MNLKVVSRAKEYKSRRQVTRFFFGCLRCVQAINSYRKNSTLILDRSACQGHLYNRSHNPVGSVPRYQGFLKHKAFLYRVFSSSTSGSWSKSPSWDSDPLTHTHEAPHKDPLCQVSRCLSPSPKLSSFSAVLFTSSCYGILFWSLPLAPHSVGVKRRGAVPRGIGLWYRLLISLGWKILVHSKCVLGSSPPPPRTAEERTLPISSAWEHWAVHKQGLSTFSKTDCTVRAATV